MIYVSPLITCLRNKNWRWNKVSHLVADSETELMNFATLELSLKQEWIQRRTMLHFDLTPSKFKLAIKKGAKLQTMREAAQWIRTHRRFNGSRQFSPSPLS